MLSRGENINSEQEAYCFLLAVFLWLFRPTNSEFVAMIADSVSHAWRSLRRRVRESAIIAMNSEFVGLPLMLLTV